MGESNKNSDNWSQTPRVSKARLMLGPRGDGLKHFLGVGEAGPPSHGVIHPYVPQLALSGEGGGGHGAEKEGESSGLGSWRVGGAGWGGGSRPSTAGRSHPGPEMHLKGGTESNLKSSDWILPGPDSHPSDTEKLLL